MSTPELLEKAKKVAPYFTQKGVLERHEPVKKTTIDELEYILTNIKDGNFLHIQRDFDTKTPCGTAHCIAGWKVILDAEVEHDDVSDSPETIELLYSEEECVLGITPWTYAQKTWDLTSEEAYALFESKATLEQQFEVLALMKLGLTVN